MLDSTSASVHVPPSSILDVRTEARSFQFGKMRGRRWRRAMVDSSSEMITLGEVSRIDCMNPQASKDKKYPLQGFYTRNRLAKETHTDIRTLISREEQGLLPPRVCYLGQFGWWPEDIKRHDERLSRDYAKKALCVPMD